MTLTTEPTTEPTTEARGSIEYLDPATLVIEANIRFAPEMDKDDKELVESIKQVGVLEPVVARRDDNGTVLVRMGQRRTIAAREAGVTTIPVFVTDAADDTARRIIEQLAENDHRKALSGAEHVAAFQQLAFEGLSISTIAKQTRHSSKSVKDALAVAENAGASEAIAKHDLTLDQAAALIEFEGDTDTVDALIEVATESPEQFAHATQRARDEKRLTAIREAATADLIGRGFTVLDHEPGYYETDWTPIRDLLTKDGEKVTEAEIVEVEGRAAFVRVYYTSEEATILYYLADPKAAGFHKDRGNAPSGPMTDEQKEERKILIANNKAWASAETVRREWLASFLSRKTLPKDAGVVIATGLTAYRSITGTAIERGNLLAHQFFGIDRADYWGPDKLAQLITESPTKTQHIILAVVLGGIESATSKETWRHPSAPMRDYFQRLSDWGYVDRTTLLTSGDRRPMEDCVECFECG
jgi:ParB family transcriptional regulator, chromosome partitioning protein